MTIFDIKWKVKTAGPTPAVLKNTRTELFLFGCKKAMSGNPCKGCFNPSTWNASAATITHPAKEVVYNIITNPNFNGYLTIGGGEPTDQLDELIELCKTMKVYRPKCHIMVYTWHDLYKENLFEDEKFSELFNYIDMVVDGEYKEDQRLYNETALDGFTNSVGSANQTIWSKHYDSDLKSDIWLGIEMGMLKNIELTDSNELIYILKDMDNYYEI